MPNHITNRLTADGPFPQHLLDGFSLQKITPRPKILDKTEGLFNLDRALKFETIVTDKREIETILTAVAAKPMTGYPDWYSWAIDNWGTKWDCYDVDVIGPAHVIFNTAWAPPDIALQTLADQTSLTLHNVWTDEGGPSGQDTYCPSR